MADKLKEPLAQWPIADKQGKTSKPFFEWFSELKRLYNLLVTNFSGTANEITVTESSGSFTISGAGSDTDFTVITAIQAGGAGGIGFQYKTRALTLNGGIITTVGAESAWNDV